MTFLQFIGLTALSLVFMCLPVQADENKTSLNGCEELLSSLLKKGDSLQDIHLFRSSFSPSYQIGTTGWEKLLNEYLNELQSSNPSPEQGIQVWDGLMQAAIGLAQLQWHVGFDEEIERKYQFVLSLMRSALQSEVPEARILATLRADWRLRESGTQPFGLNFYPILARIEDIYDMVQLLKSNPQSAYTLPLYHIKDAFFVQAIHEAIRDSNTQTSRVLNTDPKLILARWNDNGSPSSFLGWTDQNYGRWIYTRSIGSQENTASLHAFLVHLALAKTQREWLGDKAHSLNNLTAFRILHTLENTDFNLFQKYFSSFTRFNLPFYLNAVVSNEHKSMVKSLFEKSSFKVRLFQSEKVSWEAPELQNWLSISSPEKVLTLLTQVSGESSQVIQSVEENLQEKIGKGLKDFKDDVRIRLYYGDELVRSLSRLKPEQLKSAALRKLPTGLQLSFLSRTPEDLSLDRHMGEYNDFRSNAFQQDLERMFSTEKQILRIEFGARLLATARLTLHRNKKALEVENFTLHPNLLEDHRLQAQWERQFATVKKELKGLARRLGTQLIFAEKALFP